MRSRFPPVSEEELSDHCGEFHTFELIKIFKYLELTYHRVQDLGLGDPTRGRCTMRAKEHL